MTTFSVGEVIFILFLLFIIGFVIGAITSSQYHEKAAVKAGVAEWVINNENGAVKFQYIKVQ